MSAARLPPLIGISTSELRTRKTLKPIKHGGPTPSEFALGTTYVRAIENAGGLPIIVPPCGEPGLEPLLDSLAGLCLPGGPDLDPATYGAEKHPELGPYDPDVDRFELRLAQSADNRRLPILAICRGAQALNVSRGGTLIQHLPELGADIVHRQTTPGTETSHSVEVQSPSLLASITGAGTLDVNSFHHQGIERLGRDLRAVAFAPDGTIEALEATDRDFCLALQWHAETLVHRKPHAALFEAFVGAAAGAESAQPAGEALPDRA